MTRKDIRAMAERFLDRLQVLADTADLVAFGATVAARVRREERQARQDLAVELDQMEAELADLRREPSIKPERCCDNSQWTYDHDADCGRRTKPLKGTP